MPSGGRKFQSIYTNTSANIDLSPCKNTINGGLYFQQTFLNLSKPLQPPHHSTLLPVYPSTPSTLSVLCSKSDAGIAAWKKCTVHACFTAHILYFP